MPDDLQSRVNAFARDIGLPVSLTTADLDSIVFSPHSGLIIDAVRSKSLLSRDTEEWVVRWFRKAGVGSTLDPVYVAGIPEQEAMSRWVVPVHSGGRILGYLCILDPGGKCDLTVLDGLSEHVSGIGRIMLESEDSARRSGELLRRALTSEGQERVAATTELLGHLGRAEHAWMIAVGASIGAASDAEPAGHNTQSLRGSLRNRECLTVECRFDDHHAFLIASETTTGPKSLADLAPCCPQLAVGIGGPVQEPLQLARSYRQALGALRTASASNPVPRLTRWAELGPIKVLSLQNPDVLADTVDDRITALGSEAELLETVEYYLGHGRKPDLVADSLHIHRGTLYYRLRKFEDATGLDLDSGTDRLSIQLSLEALKLLRAPNWHHASP